MLDVGTISAAASSLKTIIDLVKNASDTQLAIKISAAVADVQGRLLEVQQQALALQSENHELREGIRKLKAESDEDKQFVSLHGVDWKTYEVTSATRVDESGNPLVEIQFGGPYCPLCWDSDKKRVRLRDQGAVAGKVEKSYWCEIHKIEFFAPSMGRTD